MKLIPGNVITLSARTDLSPLAGLTLLLLGKIKMCDGPLFWVQPVVWLRGFPSELPGPPFCFRSDENEELAVCLLNDSLWKIGEVRLPEI